MKPTLNRFRKLALPSLIIVPAMTVFSIAATIIPDASGNVNVVGTTSAASTILASGGTSPTPTVNVAAGASLTGDAVLQNGVVISAPNYTVTNSGSLSGAFEGISVEAAGVPGVSIINQSGGIIQGGDDGIYFDADGGSVTNFGIIRGVTGVDSDGIEAFDDLTVLNGGSISGVAGIFAGENLSVTNNAGGSIGGTNEAGIDAEDGAFIDNFGTITSTGANGIIVDDGALIFNGTSFSSTGAATSGGLIQGATNGVFAGDDLEFVNESQSRVIGLNGFGIDAGDDAEIFNETGATISGSLGGVRVQSNGYVQNEGSILGNGGDGISLGTDGEVLNAGLISGVTGIVANDGSLIVNSGIIRSTAIGGNAFSGSGADDALFLNAGSLIEGNVLGGGGINSITFNGGLTSPSSPVNFIRGDVTGFQTITKEAGGVALIGAVGDVGAGLSITADTINITGGGLYFNADIDGFSGPQATINAGGAAVGGTGVWDANINILAGGISAGAIPINLDSIPANAVGAVAITGDVTHSAGSFIRQDIVPGTPIIDGINSDIIEQIGAGNVYTVTGANLRIASTDVNGAFTPGTYTIIDSDEAIIGNVGTIGVQFNANVVDTGFIATGSGANFLNSVLTQFFVTTGFEDGNTNFVMDIDYDFAGLPGLTLEQSEIAGAIDNLALAASAGTLGATEQDFLAALTFSDVDTVLDTFSALGSDPGIGLAAGVINNNYRLHRMTQDHLAASRSMTGSVRMVETTAPPMTDAKGGMIPGQTTTSQMSVPSRGSFWGSVSYDDQDFDTRVGSDDFDGDSGALTIGYDHRVSSTFMIGGMIDGSRSDFDFDGGGDAEIDSLRFAIYGTSGEAMGFYTDFLVGYGEHELDHKRSIPIGILDSSTDASSLQAMLTFGYTMGNEQVKHGPFLGAEYQNLDVDSSDGSSPITVGSYDVESLRGLIGYRVNADMGRFRPYASVAYAHEFEDGNNRATANIGGIGGNFSVNGAELTSAVIVTAGTGIALTDSLLLDVGYRGELTVEDEGMTSHGATLGLRYSF